MSVIKVLIASRSREAAQSAADLLASNPHCETQVRILSNGHGDPLHGIDHLPDLLLLCDIDADEELQSLANTPPDRRPALVVFGPAADTGKIRTAMHAGACDYLAMPLDERELDDMLRKVSAEIASRNHDETGNLHVFINGKGGSGATFLATNIAHGLASTGHDVTLVDLDLQFAGLCRYLDLTPTRDLLDAVNAVDEMDELSARAFTSEHESGLHLLSCMDENLHLHNDVDPQRLVSLLQIYKSFNDFVIVDLPRYINPMSEAVLKTADRISIVIQQSFPHLHDASRLIQILRYELGIRRDRMTVIVNRFEKDSAILLADVEKALGIEDIVKIPNHYRSTTESVNSGVPLAEVTTKSSIARGLRDYYQSLANLPANADTWRTLRSLFRR